MNSETVILSIFTLFIFNSFYQQQQNSILSKWIFFKSYYAYITSLRRNMLYFYKLIIKVRSLPSFSFEMKKINMTKPFVWWQSSHNDILQFVIVGFPLLFLSVLDCIVWFLLSSVPLQICLFCALPATFISTKLTNTPSYKGFQRTLALSSTWKHCNL